MGRLQIVGIALAILLPSSFIWLHEHDARVRFEVQSEQQRKELEFNDQQIEGLRSSLTSISTKYLADLKEYKRKQLIANVTLGAMNKKLDSLTDSIARVLPEASKPLAYAFARVCNSIKAVVSDQLSDCEKLRQQSDSITHFQETTIWRMGVSRDGYKKLYEAERGQHNRGGVWATVGKTSTLGALILSVTKLIHLW